MAFEGHGARRRPFVSHSEAQTAPAPPTAPHGADLVEVEDWGLSNNRSSIALLRVVTSSLSLRAQFQSAVICQGYELFRV
jgi:hypothetical protein